MFAQVELPKFAEIRKLSGGTHSADFLPTPQIFRKIARRAILRVHLLCNAAQHERHTI